MQTWWFWRPGSRDLDRAVRLDRTVRDFALSCHECGYPIVDRSLCGYPGLYVVGLLAELELGPVARTIIGARHAASRVPATSRFVIKVA